MRTVFALVVIGAAIGLASMWLFNSRAAPETKPILLYFYDETLDTKNGQVLCSPESVTPVERVVPQASSTIEESVRMLLKETPTQEESDRGLSSQFPLRGFNLERLTNAGGVVTLIFNDPFNSGSGGACRVGILRAQIESTVRQFPGVTDVKILPEEILQP